MNDQEIDLAGDKSPFAEELAAEKVAHYYLDNTWVDAVDELYAAYDNDPAFLALNTSSVDDYGPIYSHLLHQLPPGVELKVPLKRIPKGKKVVIFNNIEAKVDEKGILVLPSVQYAKVVRKGLKDGQIMLKSPSRSEWRLVVPQDKLAQQARQGMSLTDQLFSVVQLYRTNRLYAQIFEAQGSFSLPGNFNQTIALS